MKTLRIVLAIILNLAISAVANSGDINAQLKAAFDNGELKGLHSVLILQHSDVLAEAYFSGDDENWGRPLGKRIFGADSLHDLRSVTKSITSLLYGIALNEGIVPPVTASLVEQFPGYPELQDDSDRQAITIADALSMTMGVEWNENLPYTDPNNSEIQMENASDRIRFVLSRPITAAPGTEWNYNGGATAVVARLIENGSGKALDAYASDRLFQPLGITDFEWSRGADGSPSAASGLRLNIRDLAKIGQLILDDGAVGNRQIVPADWLQASFETRATVGGPFTYGYQWWLAPGKPPAFVAGFGNGGQRFSINKSLGLVFVVFAGNYNDPDAWQLPVKISTEFLAPVLEKK